MHTQQFLQDLFNNPNVRYLVNAVIFDVMQLHYPKENVSEIKFQKLRCHETTLDMFDRFTENSTEVINVGLVIADRIQGTFGEEYEGIEICNLIREGLLKEESENFCLFNEKERDELLLRLFQLLLLGGSMNQYEDLLSPYLDWTKKLYKSLVTVRKDSQTNDIFIESFFYTIKKIDKTYEPGYNPQEVLYVVVNPNSRIVHVLNNRWVKFW